MIHLTKQGGPPLYDQIYRQYVDQILSGALPAGTRLPATRALAEELGLSRNTVDRAYQQLKTEGFVSSVTGSGFRVSAIPLGALRRKDPVSIAPPSVEPDYAYDFFYASMDNALFPFRAWRACMNSALDAMESAPTTTYPDRQGEWNLRAALCGYLRQSRAVDCAPEQIVITCGQQHAMEVLANLFRNGSRLFAMEEPGYDGIRRVFENRGFFVSALPTDEEGLAEIPQGRGVLLHLTPSHQFPGGAVLSVARRRRLIQWAQQTDSYLIEDDYDSELRYYTNPIPSMQSMDDSGRVIYTGTFSKSLSPSLRLAYLIFPPSLWPAYLAYYGRYNAQVNALHQNTLASFILRGHYQRHQNRLRTAYRKRIEALISALRQVFGDRVRIRGGEAGLHILAEFFPADTCHSVPAQETLLRLAAERGVRVYGTRALYQNDALCPPSQLLLGVSTIRAEDILPAAELLRAAWADVL